MWLNQVDPSVMTMLLLPATNTIWQCALLVFVCSITKIVIDGIAKMQIENNKNAEAFLNIKITVPLVALMTSSTAFMLFLFDFQTNTKPSLSGFVD